MGRGVWLGFKYGGLHELAACELKGNNRPIVPRTGPKAMQAGRGWETASRRLKRACWI